MPNYDFRSLSPHDFECISRDLLQDELGIYLESFTSGPDSGIDFRRYLGPTKVILQCKHYANSPFRTLLARMRKEREGQIARLSTSTRYILTTSLGLTPANKKDLFEILHPYCKNTADIYGRDDLNNLLSKHPSIETNHHKLWLTSTPVLQRILNNGIISDSSSHLDDIRNRFSRYVPNDSFDRATKILNDRHFCIISGIPGIGKTTLAEVLIADLVDRQDFRLFRINNKLDEIRSIKNRSERQVFYFDDFLGQIELNTLERNEDRHLVNLMNEVSKTDRWRLILTTREYILKSARNRYEALGHLPERFATCIVDLHDYTPFIRAKILYNHIYYSDLPRDHKLALLETGAYQGIIDHKNYSPRVVETMIDSAFNRDMDSEEYIADFMKNLEHPDRVWKHAFEVHISEAARHLLLILAVLPDRVCEEDAKRSFQRFYGDRHLKYGFAVAPGDWHLAMDELEGSFLSTTKVGGYITVRFHNPSVEAFMRDRLHHSLPDVEDLRDSAIFFEQYDRLWNRSSDLSTGHSGKVFARRVVDFVPGRSARVVIPDVAGYYQGTTTISAEAQVLFLVKVAKVVGTDVGGAVESALVNLSRRWEQGQGDRESLLRLLDELPKNLMDSDMEPILAARDFLLGAHYEIDDFRASLGFYEAFPRLVSNEAREVLAARFLELVLNWEYDYEDESEDGLAELADMIGDFGVVLGVNVEGSIEEVNEKVSELEERASRESDYSQETFRARDRAERAQEDVDQLFSQLRDHLADL